MSVLDNIYNVVKNVVALAHDLRNYQSEVKEIRHEIRDLAFIVQRLAQEIQHGKEMVESERVNILLEVENKLLRFEQRLSDISTGKNEASHKRKKRLFSTVKSLRLEGEKKESDQVNSASPKAKRAKG